MTQKLFTPQEANRRLPYIRQIVNDILDKGKRIKALLLLPHQSEEVQKQCQELDIQISMHLKELEEIGCYFKDWNFEIGLVDFPAIINGQEVLLCWRSDEPAVEWFHGFDDGYAGRMPITKDLMIS
jgi:hypothetical protein